MASIPQLPESLAPLIKPLFDTLPIDSAMSQLVVSSPAGGQAFEQVKRITTHGEIRKRPALGAGLWLYVDDLERSHGLCQAIKDSTGSFWHGIMHRREGDFSNSHYWFRNTGEHAAMVAIHDYDPHHFIDDVERAHQGSGDVETLVELQRREWSALMQWCAAQ